MKHNDDNDNDDDDDDGGSTFKKHKINISLLF